MLQRLKGFFNLAEKAMRYQASEAFRKAAFDSNLNAVITINSDGIVIEWNDSAERIFGWTVEEARGEPLSTLIIPEKYRVAHRAGINHYLRTGESKILERRIELEAQGKSGNVFPVELSITSFEIFDAVYFTASLRDISQRRAEEQHRKILLEELNNRVRTTLRIMRSMIRQIGRSTDANWQENYQEAIDRIDNLIRTDEMLSRTDWRSIDLKHIAQALIAVAHPEKQSNVLIVGNNVKLPSHVGVLMSMIIHELVSNALRYGALSSEHGFVSVSWDRKPVDGVNCLVWQWREFGGPHLDGPPAELGYGLKMVETAVPREIHGSVTLDWAPDGMALQITVPEAELVIGE